MNAKKLTAALIMFAAASATFAQSKEFVAPDAGFESSKSRAEVIAELKQAKSNGTLSFKEHNYPVIADRTSAQPRAAASTGMIHSAGASGFDPSFHLGS